MVTGSPRNKVHAFRTLLWRRYALFLLSSPILMCFSANGGSSGAGSDTAGPFFAYQNPNPGVNVRDTVILPDEGKFYSIGTCPPYWQGANPGVKLFSSDNLVDWKFETMLIDAAKLPPDSWYKDRFWAPELHKIKGKYYLTFNCLNESEKYRHHHACGIAVSDRVKGPYKVMTPDKPLTPWPSNDLTLFEDEDGKVYAFFNNGWTDVHKIYVAEMDMEKLRLKEEPVELFKQERGAWDANGIEGSAVVKHEGTYYLFYSSWTRGYAVGYATARDIRGPYAKSKSNPLFGAWRKGRENICVRYGKDIQDPLFPFTSLGHNQFFTGPDGRLWTSCHAYLTGSNEASMLIDPVWFENGEVKTTAPSYTPQEARITPEMLKKFPGLKSAKKSGLK